MKITRSTGKQDEVADFRQIAPEYLQASTYHLHDLPSRTDPATLTAEVERLNSAVRASVGSRISPFAQPADYQRAQYEGRDSTNDAARPARKLAVQQADVGEMLTLAAASENSRRVR